MKRPDLQRRSECSGQALRRGKGHSGMESQRSIRWCFGLAIGWIATTGGVYGQTFNKPEPADNPNLPGNSAWTAACASADFNEYFVNFTWSPPIVDPSNEFILELSDADGDFSDPTELDRVGDKNAEFDFNFSFTLPETAQGDNFRMRVRSTNPEMISPESDPFPMYYIGYKDPILISENGNGIIPPAGSLAFCSGNSITLATHSVPNPETYKYNWYRNGLLLDEKTNSIDITEEGTYQVEIDYGSSCSGSANTLSNTISISETSPVGISIDPPSQTVLCPGETLELTANPDRGDLVYSWFRDGVEVSPPLLGNSTFEVDATNPDFPGNYTVTVSGSTVCSETSAPITLSRADVPTASITSSTTVLLPGGSIELQALTTAANPTFQWYLNGSPIAGATASTYLATEAGTYSVEVSDADIPCPDASIRSADFVIQSPASYEVEIGADAGYLPCESAVATLSITAVLGLDDQGTATDFTGELLDSFSWQWYDTSGPIAGETGTSLSLGAGDSGTYHVEGTFGAISVSSSEQDILINNAPDVNLNSDRTALCDEDDSIRIELDDPLPGDSYTWTVDGTATGVTTSAIVADLPGNYVLRRTRDGCESVSQPIVISMFDPEAVVLDQEEEVSIPRGESLVVTASGGDNYQWRDPDGNPIGSDASATLDQEGTYSVEVSSGSCLLTLTITVSLRDTFPIPNVISPNGDGINDRWVIPNSYSFRSDVVIRIYGEAGNLIFEQANYQNDWPSGGAFGRQSNEIVYYIIESPEEGKVKGTITVIP